MNELDRWHIRTGWMFVGASVALLGVVLWCDYRAYKRTCIIVDAIGKSVVDDDGGLVIPFPITLAREPNPRGPMIVGPLTKVE